MNIDALISFFNCSYLLTFDNLRNDMSHYTHYTPGIDVLHQKYHYI